VVFDLDGVLVDSCDLHYEALNKAIEEVVGKEYMLTHFLPHSYPVLTLCLPHFDHILILPLFLSYPHIVLAVLPPYTVLTLSSLSGTSLTAPST
jgi:hypothetical protein